MSINMRHGCPYDVTFLVAFVASSFIRTLLINGMRFLVIIRLTMTINPVHGGFFMCLADLL